MPPTADEVGWNYHSMPMTPEFIILMPNGTSLKLSLNRETNLSQVKLAIWAQAQSDPLWKLIDKDKPSSYKFSGVTGDGIVEEFHDDNRRLSDLRLFSGLLTLRKSEGTAGDSITQAEISQAIGRPLHEFDMKDPEFSECRLEFLLMSSGIVNERKDFSKQRKLQYYFPPEMDIVDVNHSPAISQKEVQCIIYLSETPISTSLDAIDITFKADLTVSQAIEELKAQVNSLISDDDIILKICGFEEYLLGNHKLYQYKSICTAICRRKKLELLVCRESAVLSVIPNEEYIKPASHTESEMRAASYINESKRKMTSLWEENGVFTLRVKMATYANVRDYDRIMICVGLYHGTKSLCAPRETSVQSSQSPKWNESLEFDISLEDLPRSTILCLSMCHSLSTKKAPQQSIPIPIAYANIPLFTYRGELLSGRKTLKLWRIPKDFSQGTCLHPLGIIGPNPEKDAVGIEIEFENSFRSSCIVFPSDEIIKDTAQKQLELERCGSNNILHHHVPKERRISDPTAEEKLMLECLLKLDPLVSIDRDTKDLLWRSRFYCQQYLPDLLPKLLDSVRWNKREEVAQVYLLLDSWPNIQFAAALVLLDCQYTDLKVRSFAIRCLETTLALNASTDFLLQLIQVALHELYLHSDTSRFLLRRALQDTAFGHQFFWFLRAEIHKVCHRKICSLLLEAYCRGVGSVQLKSILKQIAAIEKLSVVNDALDAEKSGSLDKRLTMLRETLKKDEFSSALQHLASPLRSKDALGALIPEECRIMDSAKKPLWLVWKNGDPSSSRLRESTMTTHELIFKNGDDLRQDMLTLQVIKIMDAIWRKESLDLMMLPYSCLQTANQKGLIEVVKEARTVMALQRVIGLKAACQIDSPALHKWFEGQNSKENYERLMENFTKSCAGYCVATFVLGIGDRNPDNIMINNDGQIFHIDFGHFLGHFKKKFGINRERVPFVLIDDFIYVIARGQDISDPNGPGNTELNKYA